METEILHFKIQGEWFTWWLRHLWAEGSYQRCVKTWRAAFPELSGAGYIKTVFIDVISGKKKFVGYNTFDLVKDGRRTWNGDRFAYARGKAGNTHLPQTWDEVIDIIKTARRNKNEEKEEIAEALRRQRDRMFPPGSLSVAKSRALTDVAIASAGIPGLTLDKFVKDMIQESNRETIESEDPKKTKYSSGYISLKGDFYGCADIQHMSFSEDLCELLAIDVKEDKDSPHGRKQDAQKTLDKLGWIKVSCCRFYWDRDATVTQAQKDCIWDFMQGKGLRTAKFETDIFKEQTFDEAFGKEE